MANAASDPAQMPDIVVPEAFPHAEQDDPGQTPQPAGQDGDDHLHGLECDEHRWTCPAEPADAAGQRFFGVKQPAFQKTYASTAQSTSPRIDAAWLIF